MCMWAAQMALELKSLPAEAGDTGDSVRPLGREDPLEEGMAAHSSLTAWRIPRTAEAGGPQSTRSQRVGHTRVYNRVLAEHLTLTQHCKSVVLQRKVFLKRQLKTCTSHPEITAETGRGGGWGHLSAGPS